jgi:hypothetical protein
LSFADIVHITESSANELKNVMDEMLDIPLSSEPDANTASIVMKHTLKVKLLTIQVYGTVHWMLVQILMTTLLIFGAEYF